ncbi:MAG TPA: hypothetical protein VFH56_02105 [Acidimicrobiales bacterium]|nr:hypothetical protein [Acidimicrobiales bacterium]
MANAETELPLLAARLKAAGAVGVRAEMVAGLKAAAKPMVPKLQESARNSLPKAGGLNEYVAKRKPKVSVRTTGRTAGVRIRSQVKGNYTNTGTWRHPVFGRRANPEDWAEETYEPAAGWWDRVVKADDGETKAAAVAVLKTVAAQVQRLGI